MEIKLPHMPFRFDSPDGRMEVTVRQAPGPGANGRPAPFGAALVYLQAGPRALERIALSVKADTYSGALRQLKEGFRVNPDAHGAESTGHRALAALCQASGVVDLDQ